MVMTPNPAAPQQKPEIPDKLYFRIGEVSRLVGVKPFVLRFWETEFPQLAPKKSGSGHRLYRRKDVESVLEIKRLLYEERFTIEGARNYLENRSQMARNTGRRQKARPDSPQQGNLFGETGLAVTLQQIRRELESILKLLEG